MSELKPEAGDIVRVESVVLYPKTENEYRKSVDATSYNTVKYSIFRNGKLVFSENIEPGTIGFFKTIFLWALFGFPRVQRSLFKKAHKVADKYIENMKIHETIEQKESK